MSPIKLTYANPLAIGIICIVLALSMIGLITASPGNCTTATMKGKEIESTDIPTWYGTLMEGDTWEYYMTGTMTYAGFTVNIVGNQTYVVIGHEIVTVNNTDYYTYSLYTTGEYYGTGVYYGYEFIINGTITGTVYYNRADLALVKEDYIVNVQLHVPEYPELDSDDTFRTIITNDPPLEELDFPININEAWSAAVHVTEDNSGTLLGQELEDAEYDVMINYTCIGTETITVQNIMYDTFVIQATSDSDISTLYYCPEVKYYVLIKQKFQDLELELELVEFTWVAQPVDVDVTIDPTIARIGDPVTVSGTTLSGLTVTVEIPAANIAETTLAGADGTFSVVLSAPVLADHTPTTYDLGSHGVVVTAGELLTGGYKIATLTVHGPNLRIADADVSYTPIENIVEGDRIEITATIHNPSIDDVSNVEVSFYAGEKLINATTISYIQAQASAITTTNWDTLYYGTYQIIVKVDENNAIVEYDETDNTAAIEIIIGDNHKPELITIEPHVGDVKINETESQTFSVEAIDPDNDELIRQWYLNGVLLEGETGISYTFQSDYVGEFSSTYSPFEIKVVISDTRPEAVRESNISYWMLTVINVNRPPEITTYSPVGAEVTINEDETIEFNITINDPDPPTEIGPAGKLIVTWKLNDKEIVSGNILQYVFESEYIGEFSADYSPFIINVSVTDGEFIVSHSWMLIVTDVNRLPECRIISPLPGWQYNTTDEILLMAQATDEDNDALNFTWYIADGTLLGYGAKVTTQLIPGTYTIVLTISDGKDTISETINITVVEPPKPEPKKPKRGKKGLPGFEITLYIGAVATAACSLLYYISRRSGSATNRRNKRH